MDADQPRLTSVYAPTTRAEFNKIWKYNEKVYGRVHAAAYFNFLQEGIDGLALDPHAGKPVEDFPSLRALTSKRSSRGDGHIVIYRVDAAKQTVRILHVYHTAQDVRGRLSKKRR